MLYVSWNKSYCCRREKCKGASQDRVPTPVCIFIYPIKSSLVFAFLLQLQLCPFWKAARYTNGRFLPSYLHCNCQRRYLWIFHFFSRFYWCLSCYPQKSNCEQFRKIIVWSMFSASSLPFLSYSSTQGRRFARIQDKHQHNFRFGLNQESVSENFLSLEEQMWGWGREEISKLGKSQIPQISKVRSLLFVAVQRADRVQHWHWLCPPSPCGAEMLLISSKKWRLWLPWYDGTWRKGDSPWMHREERPSLLPASSTPINVGLPEANGSCMSSITACLFTSKRFKEVPSTQSSHFTTSKHTPTTRSLCSHTCYSINRNTQAH